MNKIIFILIILLSLLVCACKSTKRERAQTIRDRTECVWWEKEKLCVCAGWHGRWAWMTHVPDRVCFPVTSRPEMQPPWETR